MRFDTHLHVAMSDALTPRAGETGSPDGVISLAERARPPEA